MSDKQERAPTRSVLIKCGMANKTFFTADTHFGHARVVRGNCRNRDRPWLTTDEMDAALVDNWNSVVGSNDVVYHLGDVSFHTTERTKEILSSLNGRMILVPGNHDRFNSVKRGRIRLDRWYEDRLPNGSVIDVLGRKVEVRHIPAHTDGKTGLLFHGHVHTAFKTSVWEGGPFGPGGQYVAPCTMVNAGVDVWDFFPVPDYKMLEAANAAPEE